jgi:hypothetical protein
LLGYFNAKVDKENFIKPKIWNDCLHEISNYNRISTVNFATSKNLSKIQCSQMITLINFRITGLLSSHQTAGQSQDIKVAHTSFKNVAQLKYLGM